MKAAIFREAHQPLTIEEVIIDKPMAREVLVKVKASGLCHSDYHFIDGHVNPNNPQLKVPAVLGHEICGIVEAVGSSVTEFKIGDHVTACLSGACGCCKFCMTGKGNLCKFDPNKPKITMRPEGVPPRLSLKGEPVTQFTDLGGFAEKVLVHEVSLVKIRDDVPFDRAAIVGCSIVTGVGAVQNTAKVRLGSSVVIFGCGGIGIAAIQGSRIAGAKMIVAVDTNKSKLGLALKFGATHTLNVANMPPEEVSKQLIEMTSGGADYAFECIGIPLTAKEAIASVAPGGMAILIGVQQHSIEVEPNNLLKEKKVCGCYMGSSNFKLDIPIYLDLYKQGRLNLDDMVSYNCSLEEINTGFEKMIKGEVVRSVVVFD